MWKLSPNVLTIPQIIPKIRKEINVFNDNNDKRQTYPAVLWDTLKTVLRGYFIMEGARLKTEKNKLQFKNNWN